ncbi:MAG: nitrous oxide reductase accessory protein NosL [Saprospiraceae bacterium]
MKRPFFLSLLLMGLLLSCSPSPRDIAYGQDICHYCKMTIVDRQHAAQLVTDKGKVTNYDAIECMINFVNNNPEMNFAFTLVNDYANPSALIDAHSSHYLISKAIPSPMGRFLSAFSGPEVALRLQEEKGGKTFDWNGIKKHISSDATNLNK